MTKREQIKNKITTLNKCFHNAPFGALASSIFTTQTLAKVKLQHEKKINCSKGQEKLVHVCRQFI